MAYSNVKTQLVRNAGGDVAREVLAPWWRFAKHYAGGSITSKAWLTYTLPYFALRDHRNDLLFLSPVI